MFTRCAAAYARSVRPLATEQRRDRDLCVLSPTMAPGITLHRPRRSASGRTDIPAPGQCHGGPCGGCWRAIGPLDRDNKWALGARRVSSEHVPRTDPDYELRHLRLRQSSGLRMWEPFARSSPRAGEDRPTCCDQSKLESECLVL